MLKSFKRCITNTTYISIFLIFILLVFNSLYLEYSENIGLSEFFIRTASEISFLQNNLTRHYMTVLTIIGPLLTMIACSMLYVNDCEANMIPCIYMRINKRKYHIANIISVFLSAFLLIFLPLIISYLISLIACPANIALDNMTATPTFTIEYTKNSILDIWKVFYPVYFTIFHIVTTSIIFALFACCGYIITLYVQFNKYISISIIFLCYIIYNIGLAKIGLSDITFFNIIDPYANKVSILGILSILFIFTIIIGILFFIGLYRDKKNV